MKQEPDITELEQNLAEARQLLRDVNKPTPFRVELIGSLLLAVAIFGVALLLHHIFPQLDADDLRFWGFIILAIPIIIGALWIGFRRTRKSEQGNAG